MSANIKDQIQHRWKAGVSKEEEVTYLFDVMLKLQTGEKELSECGKTSDNVLPPE